MRCEGGSPPSGMDRLGLTGASSQYSIVNTCSRFLASIQNSHTLAPSSDSATLIKSPISFLPVSAHRNGPTGLLWLALATCTS